LNWLATGWQRIALPIAPTGLVLLDDGMSCEAIAGVLLIDDDTIRTWYRLYQEDGIEGLASFGYEGGACRLTARNSRTI
jgi:transposase